MVASGEKRTFACEDGGEDKMRAEDASYEMYGEAGETQT